MASNNPRVFHRIVPEKRLAVEVELPRRRIGCVRRVVKGGRVFSFEFRHVVNARTALTAEPCEIKHSEIFFRLVVRVFDRNRSAVIVYRGKVCDTVLLRSQISVVVRKSVYSRFAPRTITAARGIAAACTRVVAAASGRSEKHSRRKAYASSFLNLIFHNFPRLYISFNQPFNPSIATPSISCFWKMKNSTAGTILIITPAAIRIFVLSFPTAPLVMR